MAFREGKKGYVGSKKFEIILKISLTGVSQIVSFV